MLQMWEINLYNMYMEEQDLKNWGIK